MECLSCLEELTYVQDLCGKCEPALSPKLIIKKLYLDKRILDRAVKEENKNKGKQSFTIKPCRVSLQPLDKTKLQFNKTESSSDEGFEEIEEKSGRAPEQSRRKSKVLICDVCNQKFSMESTLRCHRLEKHQKFYSESEIEENTEESDDEDFEEFSDEDSVSDSTEDDKVEIEESETEDTEESVDDEAEIPPEKSEFSYPTSKTLRKHNENSAKHNLENEEPNKKEPETKKMFQIFQYVCDICHQSFVNKDTLAKHSETHNENKENEEKSGSVPEQSKRKSTVLIKLKRNQEFRKESHLKNHVIENHEIGNETKKADPEPFKCDTCHRQFSCQNTFDTHMDTCQVRRDKSDFDCEDSKAEDTEESVDNEAEIHASDSTEVETEESETEDTKESVDNKAEIPPEKSEFSHPTSKTLQKHNENSAKHNLENEEQNEKETSTYEKLPFPCDHCPRSFATLVGVKRHSTSMHLKRTTSVDEDEEPSKKKAKVDDHDKNDDEEIQTIPDFSHLHKRNECTYICIQCQFRTEDVDEMGTHYESHTMTNE